MALVANSALKSKEASHAIRYVKRTENILGGNIVCSGMDEIYACIVAGNVDVAIGVSAEATCKWREVRESLRKRLLEVGDEGIDGERWMASEQDTLLDVMARKHREITD